MGYYSSSSSDSDVEFDMLIIKYLVFLNMCANTDYRACSIYDRGTDKKEMYEIVLKLSDERNMRVTLNQSARGAVICGTSCFLGGLLGGPAGMAIGGTIGAVSAWKMSSGQFKPVSEVIRNDLTASQQKQLYDHIIASVRNIEVSDATILLPLLINNSSIQTAILNTVVSFIGREMRLQIVD